MEILDKKTGEVIYASCSGSRDFTPIDWEYSEADKCFVPKPGKTIDIYNMIQLHKDSTDLANIIARYNAGDVSALNVRTGAFMDVTDAPKSLNELAAFQARIDKSWADLDPKVRELFGNDLNTFASALMNNEIDKTIQSYYDSHKTDVKEEVKADV